MSKLKKDNDFVTFEHKFKDDDCNPKHGVNVSLSKQNLEALGIDKESFWITVWGKWGKEDHQLDLEFKNKNECIKFINGLSAVVKSGYDKIEPNQQHIKRIGK